MAAMATMTGTALVAVKSSAGQSSFWGEKTRSLKVSATTKLVGRQCQLWRQLTASTGVDLILIMSGFGGQSFIETQVKKIADLRRMCAEKGVNPWIEVDGGVTPKNAYKVIEARANALVAGSAVFGAKSYAELSAESKPARDLKQLLWQFRPD